MTSVVYNKHFDQLITCSSTAVVRVWNAANGELIFEFGGIQSSQDGTMLHTKDSPGHNGSQITAALVDFTGRRLVTSARDGKICIWNPNSGACLKTLVPQTARKFKEVHDIVGVTINQRNKFFCAVGWDKRIRLYPDFQGGDIQDEYKQYQHPMPFWKSDLDHGHRDDIVAVTYCPPHLLATCDYSGNIFLWNLVSGHIFKKFLYKSAKPIKDSSVQINHCIAGFSKRHEENEKIITEQFSRPSTRNLQTDMKKLQSAVLVVGTVDGHVSFYSTSAVNSHASFCVTSRDNNKTAPSITKIKISLDETRMVVGDADGYITILDVENYALSQEKNPPRILYRWRAHVSSINDIEIVVRPDTGAQLFHGLFQVYVKICMNYFFAATTDRRR